MCFVTSQMGELCGCDCQWVPVRVVPVGLEWGRPSGVWSRHRDQPIMEGYRLHPMDMHPMDRMRARYGRDGRELCGQVKPAELVAVVASLCCQWGGNTEPDSELLVRGGKQGNCQEIRSYVNSLRSEQNGWHLTDDIFFSHFLLWKCLWFESIFSYICSERFSDNKSALVQLMAWHHAITWTNIDQDVSYHMASIHHNELTHWGMNDIGGKYFLIGELPFNYVPAVIIDCKLVLFASIWQQTIPWNFADQAQCEVIRPLIMKLGVN